MELGEYSVPMELSEIIVDWRGCQHRFLREIVGSLEMLGCVNLQSEQEIGSHNGVFSVLIAIETIVGKLTQTSK
jgi:hypothetical protein